MRSRQRWGFQTVSFCPGSVSLFGLYWYCPSTERLTSARASAEKGVSSAGFTTTVQPAARAAPTLRVIMALGKFHWGQKSRRGCERKHCLKVHRQEAIQQTLLHNWQANSSPAPAQVSLQPTETVNLRDSGTKAHKDREHFQNLKEYKTIYTRGQ